MQRCPQLIAKAQSCRKRSRLAIEAEENMLPGLTRPGEEKRTAEEERWTSCDLATGLAVSPLGCTRDALPSAQKPGHTPEGSRSACEEAQPLRRALPWGVRTAGASELPGPVAPEAASETTEQTGERSNYPTRD
ncbi:uncharacterized protein AAG666_024607 isoform 1-T1 [Megaptera novaeangliae]